MSNETDMQLIENAIRYLPAWCRQDFMGAAWLKLQELKNEGHDNPGRALDRYVEHKYNRKGEAGYKKDRRETNFSDLPIIAIEPRLPDDGEDGMGELERCLARGMTQPEIAALLNMPLRTVEWKIRRLKDQYQCLPARKRSKMPALPKTQKQMSNYVTACARIASASITLPDGQECGESY